MILTRENGKFVIVGRTRSLSPPPPPPAALPSAILTLRFSPYQRGIYCDDQSIDYPYRRDTISHGTMAAVTITCSIVIVSPAASRSRR